MTPAEVPSAAASSDVDVRFANIAKHPPTIVAAPAAVTSPRASATSAPDGDGELLLAIV